MSDWDAVKALNELDENKSVLDATGKYNIMRGGKEGWDNYYSCSCPGWLCHKAEFVGAGPVRTCKHLKAFRGEEAEVHRCNSQLQAIHLDRFKKPWDGKILTDAEKKAQKSAAAKQKRQQDKGSSPSARAESAATVRKEKLDIPVKKTATTKKKKAK